jgi:hypothetical protein
MNMKKVLLPTILTTWLCFGAGFCGEAAAGVSAKAVGKATTKGARKAGKEVGNVTKKAGKETGKAGREVAKGAEKVGKGTAKAVK